MIAAASMPRGEYGRRRQGALAVAGSLGLDGLLVTHLPDVRYLCGFSGSSGVLLLLTDGAYLVTDFRYREQSRLEVVGARTVMQDAGIEKALREVLAERARKEAHGRKRKGSGAEAGVAIGKKAARAGGAGEEKGVGGPGGGGVPGAGGRLEEGKRPASDPGGGGGGAKKGAPIALGFDPEHLPYAEVVRLRRALRGMARLVPLKSSLAALRAPKSPSELELIRRGINIAQRAFREALRGIDGRTTETALAAAIDAVGRRLGAEAPSFETIVASGKRGALVHARPSRSRLAGAAVIDWGVVHEGYRTDCTRTLAVGRVPTELRRAHALVLEAQERALEVARQGVRARDVDGAARDLIEKAGYGKAFGHGLGHGVGLEVHERPHVGAASRDVLEEGMVFTVEPGIYLPGVGGVRVEDMAVVTRDGAELLTTLPRTLDISDYV